MANKTVERSRFIQPLRSMITDDVREWFVGVDHMVDELAVRWEQAVEEFNHFPASTVERINDSHYRISLRVPGYDKADLAVSVVGGEVLRVTGNHRANASQGTEVAAFDQRFLLADTMHVDSAKLSDGILTIEVAFPEATWAKDVAIRIE